MSFASETKEELCGASRTRPEEVQAEAYGVLLFCNQFSGRGVRVVTESEAFACRLPELFQAAFGVSFDRLPREDEPGAGKRVFAVEDPDKLALLCGTFGYDPRETLAHHINFAVLEEAAHRSAFFRGAFLAGGSVTDPAKRYHLELATSHYSVSRELCALLREEGFPPKDTTRNSNYLVYFKQSGVIREFLARIGAAGAAERVASARASKAVVGSVNRRVNCDAANLDKAVEAAQEQIGAIRRLEARGMLPDLPDKLREAAALRTAHPELTLSQLSELCDPPVSKSAFAHRLRKLMELSKG